MLRTVCAAASLALPLMLASSCLITSSPEFQDPERTAPFFLHDTAVPDARAVVQLEWGQPTLTLQVQLRSEDAKQPVFVATLLDYGWPNPQTGTPYRRALPNKTRLDPGSYADDGRIVRVDVDIGVTLQMQPGCHRITLMASHAFDDATGCPASEDDYSQITWTVIQCDSEGNCPVVDPTDTQKADENDPSCPPVEVTCRDAAVGGAQ